MLKDNDIAPESPLPIGFIGPERLFNVVVMLCLDCGGTWKIPLDVLEDVEPCPECGGEHTWPGGLGLGYDTSEAS